MIKKILQNFFLIILSLISIFFILELSIRFIFGDTPRSAIDFKNNDQPIPYIEDKILGWKPKTGEYIFPPWSSAGKKTKLTILKDGNRFNGNVKNEKEQKIIFIGGSLTQGQAVDDSETFAWILQKKIKNYEIKNYGVGGYGGTQSLLKLKNIFKKEDNIKFVIYGFIPHHEIRNIAAGSWMSMLKKNSRGTGGKVRLPYAYIKNDNLTIHKPKKYLELPFGEKSALITKIEKRLLKLESFKRSLRKTEISQKIILDMNKISENNQAKFIFLFLNTDELTKKKISIYNNFLEKNNLEYIKCQFPKGEGYSVKGEGHPNKRGHESISNCVYDKFLAFDKL